MGFGDKHRMNGHVGCQSVSTRRIDDVHDSAVRVDLPPPMIALAASCTHVHDGRSDRSMAPCRCVFGFEKVAVQPCGGGMTRSSGHPRRMLSAKIAAPCRPLRRRSLTLGIVQIVSNLAWYTHRLERSRLSIWKRSNLQELCDGGQSTIFPEPSVVKRWMMISRNAAYGRCTETLRWACTML